MTAPASSVPLRLDFIEAKPKRFIQATSYRETVRLAGRRELLHELGFLRTCVKNGTPIPARFYRSGRGDTPDRLLAEDAIMHLHFGRPDTPELMFLRQYADRVVLLEVSNHYHFEHEPPGSVLRQLHDAEERAWRAAEETRKVELREKVRAGLLSGRQPATETEEAPAVPNEAEGGSTPAAR